MKDLGVSMASDLRFSLHCSKVAVKASQSVGLIYRAFASKNVSFIELDQFLNITVKYGPLIISRILILFKSVQRSFTKRIYGLAQLSYPQRLLVCNLEPLELRRLKRDFEAQSS